MDHVQSTHRELSRAVDRQDEPRGVVVVALVHELPRELLPDGLHLERVVARVGVSREHDRADDPDRGDENRRHGRPEDLEPGVPVDRRPVAVVVLGTRHFQTEKTTTAATSEKITIETIVANQ